MNDESSPLDASLEAVLPGVHERLDGQRKAIQDLQGLVEKLEGTMKSVMQQTRDDTMNRLEIEIHRMFRNIGRNGNSICFNAEDDRSLTMGEISERNDQNCERINHPSVLVNRPFMPITYRSLQQLYNHWIGKGEYEEMYPGGIQKLEVEMGAKWRKNWDNAANKRLSKVKAIISAIESKAKEEHQSVSVVLSTWEDVYGGACKGKLSNFHSWLVEQGKVQVKKARGKFVSE